ncbi:MAG: PRTRC system protein E [Bacteroidetes bacterium]|nr:PRTRC system protein E [Bacteroidota bacterium]
MQTNFFERLSSLNVTADFKISIQKKQNDAWLVSVLVINDKVEDDAKNAIPPMILQGTTHELDEGFFPAIEMPAQKTATLLSSMQQYLDELETAKQESKMMREKEDAEKKQKDERSKKFEEQMKKVAELEEKEKYGEAIAQLPKPDKFPEHTEEIKNKLEELKSKHGQLSLL